jgi:hypothetical protein
MCSEVGAGSLPRLQARNTLRTCPITNFPLHSTVAFTVLCYDTAIAESEEIHITSMVGIIHCLGSVSESKLGQHCTHLYQKRPPSI